MPAVFADTGYWIALWDPEDSLNERAIIIGERLGESAIVTSRLVLTEVLNYMAGRGAYRRRLTARMVQELEDNPDVTIIPQTDAQFRAAVQRYAARGDQRWSLTDCASFLAMEERGITEALAYDRDFEQAGFVALLREGQA